jgi:hypothetical protein
MPRCNDRWGYDGGILSSPQMGAPAGGSAVRLRLATRNRDGDSIWVVAIFVLNCGVVALSFGAPVRHAVDRLLASQRTLTVLAPADG